MSLDDQTTVGDYAPQPPKRRGISRGRKALIGLMAIGAFAATSGAGTFASFTASTDNPGGALGDGNNPFQTPDFELTNTILARSDGSGPTTACESSDTTKPLPGMGATNDVNAAYCDALLLFDDFATTATADLKLENTGASDGDLLLYSVDVDLATGGVQRCAIDVGVKNLCGDWELTVQEYSDGGELLGSATPDFNDDGNRVQECVIPFAAGSFCGSTGTSFDSLPLLASAVNIGSLPFADAAGGQANSDVRYFKVRANLPKSGCTDTAENAGAGDGYDDATGLGCHNYASNGSAKIQVRWVLQG